MNCVDPLDGTSGVHDWFEMQYNIEKIDASASNESKVNEGPEARTYVPNLVFGQVTFNEGGVKS